MFQRTRKSPPPALAALRAAAPARAAPAARPARWERLDALRGVALLWMTLFHAAFDLSHLGLIERLNFRQDPLWSWMRVAILSTFLLCAGASQVAAHEAGVSWPRFWRRWAQLAGCAVLVSLGSWWMFPTRWISFGVLHALLLMLLLARLLAGRASLVWLAMAAAAWALPQFWRHEVFDTRWTNWTGLVTHRPATEDYVPLMPWLAALLAGMALMRWGLRHHRAVVEAPLASALRPLALIGRWSLTWYMLHQPLLLGLLQAWIWLRR